MDKLSPLWSMGRRLRAGGLSKVLSVAIFLEPTVAATLATYLIPGCVGRGVRLGSEHSSGGVAGGGVWKSGNVSWQNVPGKCFTANAHAKRH